ncbi:Protein CBG25810 [Caenorhabditis briggsae]|uniref:Protein CBG25810 n=1 Tax=Caenorhabditis briggsae TaxID=6238 RepID=B6IJV3_CAEBR|nr:Protein CBG25810 [Caenorhabditis briggsae]CAS00183.1 Protein CBG25810 [Caenorhabditis briggsae]
MNFGVFRMTLIQNEQRSNSKNKAQELGSDISWIFQRFSKGMGDIRSFSRHSFSGQKNEKIGGPILIMMTHIDTSVNKNKRKTWQLIVPKLIEHKIEEEANEISESERKERAPCMCLLIVFVYLCIHY